MSTSTLTSLAILKVDLDRGNDYLDYLKPFVVQTLVNDKYDAITSQTVKQRISTHFGLDVPGPTIEVVLKRIARSHPIKKLHGVYQVVGKLADPEITSKSNNALHDIELVLNDLMEFSETTIRPIRDKNRAVTAICAFLSRFDISCLRSYLRGTAIPSVADTDESDIVLVSNFVHRINLSEPKIFKRFLTIVQGHMLANALVRSDLSHTLSNYKRVSFFFDTPLLIQAIGAEGAVKQSAVIELINILLKLHGKPRYFSHTYDELKHVLLVSADKINASDARSPIVFEARKNRMTRSDLILLAETCGEKLSRLGLEEFVTPRHINEHQIDEDAFQELLDREVSYMNPRAEIYDINSLRSIYAIRKGRPVRSVEKCVAIFVTSNVALAKAAWRYDQQYEPSFAVSSMISDLSLANIAWLKVPMVAPSIPRSQLLSFSYAAMQPTHEILTKYLAEIDRLERNESYSPLHLQLLRNIPYSRDELSKLTLGDASLFGNETATEILERLLSELKREEGKKLLEEEEAHRQTHDLLLQEQAKRQETSIHIRAKCLKWSQWVASFASAVLALIVAAVTFGLSNRFTDSIVINSISSIVLGIISFISIVFGTNVLSLHGDIKRYFFKFFLARFKGIVDG